MKMKYVSTRGGMELTDFSAVTIEGLATDGGLTVPWVYPYYSRDGLERLRKNSYQDIALDILAQFSGDIPKDDLESIIRKTYTKEKFRTNNIITVSEIDKDVYLSDLSNGPSLAFKDIALQLLGNLFEYILDKKKDYLNIVGSSSGDTVTAAEEAVRGKNNVVIFMLTPYGRMSKFQTAQAYSILDTNVHNLAARNSVFDDCQDMSKAVSKGEFKKKYHIGAVNSYNWARVAAQIVYYFKSYFDVTNNSDQEVDFAVPTGNFGDILAGYIAKQMGLPIRSLILATNENNVLDEFFKTGVYRVRKKEDVVETSSQSQDISKASNFERFLFDVFEKDPVTTRMYMQELERTNVIDLRDSPYCYKAVTDSDFVSGMAAHRDRIETIRKVYQKSGIVIDPHTANGVFVGEQYREEGVPLVCLGTAKSTKFEDTIFEALGFIPPRPLVFEGIEQKPQRFTEIAHGDIGGLKRYIEEHAIKNN